MARPPEPAFEPAWPAGQEVRAAVAGDAEELGEFFEAAGSACYCRYHDFAGDAREFQWTMATCPEQNREALTQGLGSQVTGLVALESGRIIGWLRYGAPDGNKLLAQRLYRGLPVFSGPREHVLSVYCLLVLPSRRRAGVARALLSGLIELGPRLGFRVIEALPRGAEGVRDEELWTGPTSLYRAAGFVVVHDFGPYPVLRLELGGSAGVSG